MSDTEVAERGPATADETTTTTDSGARTAYLPLLVGLVLAAVFVARSGAGDAPVVFLVVAAYGTVLTYVGALRMPPGLRRPWWFFAAAQTLALTGDSLLRLYTEVLHVTSTPTPADVAFLLEYPALALGFLWLVRARRRGDRAAFLDAAILSTGFIVVGSVFAVAPAAVHGGTTLLSQVVAGAYPAGDLLVLTLLVRLFTNGMGRNPALWVMLGSIATLLVGDVCYVMSVARDVPYAGWVDAFYLLSYLLLGVAALHPGARRLTEPAEEESTGITTGRLMWLGGALMVAPVTSEVARLTGFEHGSWVVLLGGCVVAVLVVLRLADLVSDLQSTAVQLAALARRDGLTGVPNRRTWDHELVRACARARDHGTPLTAAVLDLDRFKDYNDTHGHLSGDRVLKETAAAWSQVLDDRGFLARYGGEEFTVLLPDLSPTDALPVLEQLRLSVADGQTCSVGAAGWDRVESPAAMVARADQALYHAKRAGRDRIAIHDGESSAVVTGRAWEDRALQSLRTVYQPIVDLETGELVGREALSRFEGQSTWHVFERARRDGSAVALEAAAIRSALEGWDGHGWLSVNVSLGSLVSSRIREVFPADMSAIVVELTEEEVECHPGEVQRALDLLRARGARIALDDYGMGSSGVQRAITFHPDLVKLDMSLVRDLDHDRYRRAVVSAVVSYAEQTGTTVLAEGIETEAERDAARRLGVTLGQGYLLGRPAPLPTTAERPGTGSR
ncbi:MAG TPA: EAL domain-containing protein [Nocardioides sp.]|nr:EAL domain-containing protein [Nocardioides sp.]